MTKREGTELLIGAYIQVIRRTEGDNIADKLVRSYEKNRVVEEAEQLTKER